jgi:hypothetical protein
MSKKGMILHLSQAIRRSVQNGMHKQACPYLVHFSMEIDFGPTLRHKMLLASVYERKLSIRFSGLALYLIAGYQSCWQIVISQGNCKAFIQLPYSSLGYYALLS